MKDTLAFVMAGGRGERLMPLTRDRTKPAVPFGGIYRLIDFTLSNCVNSQVYKIIVLPQYKSQSLTDHLEEGWNISCRHNNGSVWIGTGEPPIQSAKTST